MPRYASKTEVPVERSRAEIEETVRKYGATKFNSGWDEDRNSAVIMFYIHGLYIRFTIPLPKMDEERFVWKKERFGRKKRTEQQQYREWDQEIRQRWRALMLATKCRLEAVECQISTVEAEFL